jgi:hypothetical protein
MYNPISKQANEWNRQFSKEVQVTNKYMKKMFLYLAIKKMQIQTTLRFHLTSVRMVFIKKTVRNAMEDAGGRGRGKGIFAYC